MQPVGVETGATVDRGVMPNWMEDNEIQGRGWHDYMAGARTGNKSVDPNMRTEPNPAPDNNEISRGKYSGLGQMTTYPDDDADIAAKRAQGGGVADDEPPDLSAKYNTPLSPAEEAAYQKWGVAQAETSAGGPDAAAALGGHNPAQDTYDYDMRGFWKAANGNPSFADNGHAGDAFKKPNHPTFSTYSQYHGVDGNQGGTWGGGQNGKPWTFTPSQTNLKNYPPDKLRAYFQDEEPGNTLVLLRRRAEGGATGPANDLDPVFDEAGQRFGVDPDLLRAQAAVESGGNRYAISPKGAVGIMQVMPETYGQLREQYPDLSANPFHARSNVMAGAAYLRQMHDQFGPSGAVAAYNAGPGKYQDYLNGDADLPDETQKYVSKVTDAYSKKAPEPPPQPKTPDVRALIDRSRKMGASDDEIRAQMQKSPLLSDLWKKSDAAGISRDDVFGHFGLQAPPPTRTSSAVTLPPAQRDSGGDQTDPTLVKQIDANLGTEGAIDQFNRHLPAADDFSALGGNNPSGYQPPAALPHGYVGEGKPYQGGMDFNLPGGERHFTPGEVKVPGQDVAGAYRAAAAQGLVGGTGQAIKAGSEIYGAVSAGEARPMLAAMDTIDQGKAGPGMFQGLSDAQRSQATAYLRAPPDQRQQMRAAMSSQVASENQPGPVGTVGQRLIDQSQSNFPIDPSRAGFGTNVVRGAAGAIPMLGAAAAGTALGGPAGGVVAGAAVIGAQSFDSTRQDALAKGAAPEVADRAATESALANMGIMALPVGRVLQSIPEIGSGVLRAIRTMAQNGFEFGSFNALSQFVTNYVKKTTFDPDQKLMEGTGQAAAEGTVTGMLFGVPHAAAEFGRTAGSTASDMFARGARGVNPPGSGEGFTAENEMAPPPAPPTGAPPGTEPPVPPGQPGAPITARPAAPPPAAAPSQAETALADIAAGKPTTGGVQALEAMAQGKPPAAQQPPPPVQQPPSAAPPAAAAAPPSRTPTLDQLGQQAAQANAQAAEPPAPLPNEVSPGVSVSEEPEPFEWATAKVGDRLPDGRGVIAGKAMTSKADAEAMAERENGTVWLDGPRKWAVVVPEREEAPQAGTPVDQAAAKAVEPTAAQAEAGNYQKGHTSVGGMPVTIETAQGSMRRGVGADGQPWEVQMPGHYGYFKRTDGADGDHLDVTLGPYAHQAERHPAFIVDQIDPKTGKFDEHKTFVGYPNAEAATAAYDASFSDGSGPARRGAVNAMSFPDFKQWAENGDTTKALSYQEPAARPQRAPLPPIRPLGTYSTPEQIAQAKAEAAERDRLDPQGPRPLIPADEPPSFGKTTFTTAKGSTYEVQDDGTTTRNKAFRPEHGEADQGPQPRSQATFYATPEQVNALSEFQTQGGPTKSVDRLPDGSWGVRYVDGPSAGKWESRTVVKPQGFPAVGLTPVEVWNDGRRVHFGNPITEVRPASAQPSVAETRPALPAPEQPAPPRIRSIQQIQDQEKIGPKKAAQIQEQEIAALGRPITNEEREARAAGVATASTPPSATVARPRGNAFETVPKEPQRLVNFLRAPWTDQNGVQRPGGVRDDGGNIRSIIGGNKGRPGLINSRGDSLDNATLRAWQAGFLPEISDRPMINDLLGKIDHDHNMQPVYSMHDADSAEAYRGAMTRNAEIDRLASEHGIDTTGLTRTQFFDTLADRLSLDDLANVMQSQADAADHEFRYAQRAARAALRQQAGEGLSLEDVYGQSQARSLQDLENEYREIEASEVASAGEQRSESDQQPGPAAIGEGSVPEGTEPRGGGAGAGHSGATETPSQNIKHFYVSAIEGQKRHLVTGPYASLEEAKDQVANVRQHADTDPRAHFMAWGTAGTEAPVKTPLGENWKPGSVEPEQVKQTEVSTHNESDLPLVQHTTKRGKVIDGVVRQDISYAEAKALDPYTFKKDGGWFIRRDPAVSGKSVEAAANPATAVQDVADAEREAIAQRTQQGAKLRAAAASVEAKADEDIGRDRQSNTTRRARMAASAVEDASQRAMIAHTMRNIAGAIENGEAPHLAGINSRVQIEALDQVLRQGQYRESRAREANWEKEKGAPPTEAAIPQARMPNGSFHRETGRYFAKALPDRGFSKLKRWLQSATSDGYQVVPTSEQRAELQDAIKKASNDFAGKQIKDALFERARFERMGIKGDDDLHAALREYLPLRGGVRAEDPIKKMERDLVGNKGIGTDFFPTPPELVQNLVREADVKPGMRVLEPSAGKGDIADALRSAGAQVDTVEVSNTLRNILQAKGHNVVGQDFTDFVPDQQYDRIVMNPPFSDRMDAVHVQHAYDLLKPGGRLVAIMGEGSFFGSDKKAVAFRDWLGAAGGSSAKLPEGSFKSAFRPTGVATRMVVIDKPGEVVASETAAAPAPAVDSMGRAAGSWVVTDKATGQPVMETHEKTTADAINKDKFNVVPVLDHLAGLNKNPTETADRVPPTDLLGRPIRESAERTTEPTIRNDPNQAVMPGMGPSAVQAQAARDAAPSRSGQEAADEGLFARAEPEQPSLPDSAEQREEGSGPTKLYSFPGMLADPDGWKALYRAAEPVLKPMIRAAGMAVDAGKKLGNGVADSFAPIRTGSVRAQAFATDFANSLRQVYYHYGQIDREIVRGFTPEQRDTMGRALDAQSVFEQQVRDLPPDRQTAARAEFDRDGKGLASLPQDQRRVIDMLNALSVQTWRRLQERGLVQPDARPIPYYMPRQLFAWTEETGYTNVRSGQAGSGHGIEPIGGNLTTAGPMRREHLTPEETEAAARAKLGANVSLLRDIRSLPARIAYSERTIAGVDLINRIADVGRDIGVDTVIRGDIPGLLKPADYFTIADHPSFRQWTGAGWRATHVAREFEGPLKAVLTRPSPEWYRGAQQLKGGIMSAIMYSPFIHLAVELGRTLPVMPGKVLSFQWIKQGATLRRNLDYMDTAIRDGVAPLGQTGGWATDPASLADPAFGQSKIAFVRAIERAHSAMADRLRSLGGETLGNILANPHQTLLWDQVFNLQMSIYDTMRSRYIAKGFEPEVAGTMAAHIANRYAGALPAEHLHRYANMASNLLLFSRSFTLGNLGVMKDMFTGAPPHILSRIQQMAGPEVRDQAQAQLRRKAVSAVALDIGLFYIGVAVAQLGIQALSQGVDDTYNKWLAQSRQAMHDLGNGNPLAVFEFLPQHWNEPGKQDRVYAGTDNDGKGVYLRLPPGKVGEEFIGWMAKPGVMLESKASPIVRPIIEDIFGHDSLGRELFPPNPQTAGDYARIAGLAVKHVVEGWGPTSTIEGASDLVKGHILGWPTHGDQGMSVLKMAAPATGLAQVSSGYPGGPAAGVIHALSERQRFEWQKQLPGIRDQIKSGDTDGAQSTMTGLGMPPSLQRFYIQQTLNPGASKGASRQFEQTATPEERARRDLVP